MPWPSAWASWSRFKNGAGAAPGPLGDAVAEAILATLLRLNSELAHYVPAAPGGWTPPVRASPEHAAK